MRIAAERDLSIHGGTFNDVRGDYITNIMNSGMMPCEDVEKQTLMAS